jgi:uncharacterized protein (TIGR02270 family)
VPDLKFIPGILEEHLEELGFLWARRRAGLRDPDYTLTAFLELEQRIKAHLAGILVVGDESLPLLEAGLSSDDGATAFASAYALLHRRAGSSLPFVLDAFRASEGERLAGLRDALSHGPVDAAQPEIETLSRTSPPAIAAAAAEALTFHSALRAAPPDIERFLTDPDPVVRQSGWRLVGYLGLSLDAKAYGAAMRDDDPGVRRAALEAGAWCGEPGVLAFGRKAAEDPRAEYVDALYLLAVLGGPEDLIAMTHIAAAQALGPARYRLLGAYGNPALMGAILDGMADADARTAVAAGAAFFKMTGHDVESNYRVTLPPADGSEPDEFEAEFLDDAFLPDQERARRLWAEIEGSFADAARICRGFNLQQGIDQAGFALLDMESRWEVCLRARYHGAWDGSPLSLEIFPQSRQAQ